MCKSRTVFRLTELQLPSFEQSVLILEAHLCPMAISSISGSRKLILSCFPAFTLEHSQPSCPFPAGVSRTGCHVLVPSVVYVCTWPYWPHFCLLWHLLAYPKRFILTPPLEPAFVLFWLIRNFPVFSVLPIPLVLSLCHLPHTCKAALRSFHQGHCQPSLPELMPHRTLLHNVSEPSGFTHKAPHPSAPWRSMSYTMYKTYPSLCHSSYRKLWSLTVQ